MYEDYLPERLAKLRLQKGVSARDMSLSLGQSENYINMIENKKNLPSMTGFFNICDFLDITPGEFFEHKINNPEKFNKLIEGLMKLDDNVMEHLLVIVTELARDKA